MNEARMENRNCTSLKRPENRRDGYIVLFFSPSFQTEGREETILEIQPLSSAPVRIQTLSLARNLRATRICHSGESLRKKELHAYFAFPFLFFPFLVFIFFSFFVLVYSICQQ